jgi:predicted neuraminidase
VIAVFAAAFNKVAKQPMASQFQTGKKIPSKASTVKFRHAFASSRDDVSTHASSLIELKDGNIRAFWFSGSREGAADVEIHTSVFYTQLETWGEERSIANRIDTQRGLHRYISKLGNPVPLRAADGSLQLFYVSVSLGGWAGSSITRIDSYDDGETWGAPHRLITSPFLNISTLVKSAPIQYQDGSMGLPIYHEFIGKFSELLHLDQQGNVLDKQRLTIGSSNTLQPVVLLKSASEAQVLMRNASAESPRRVKLIETKDAGTTWSSPASTNLSNPDAAISAVQLSDGLLLAALNDIEEGRDTLVLAISRDGLNWNDIYRLEDQRGERSLPEDQRASHIAEQLQDADKRFGNMTKNALTHHVQQVKRQVCAADHCAFEFSYPYLLRTMQGEIHLSYTWNRRYIKHVVISEAWLNQQIARSAND